MKRTRLHRWTLWLLPLLVARAFVPVGFMVSADSSGLSLVFCTTISSADAAPAHAGHHDHSSEHDQADEELIAGAAVCPFAVASVLVSHEVPVIAAEPLSDLYTLSLDSTLPLGPQLLRSHSIRGPPLLT